MRNVITLLCFFAYLCCAAQDAFFAKTPLRETRAVWLATLNGLDWPRAKAVDVRGVQAQKQELSQMLDALQRIGINTVLLQTRIRGTVIYPSAIEAWDACLTGRAGRSPGYDPLAFAIDECHKRGMQLHAWVVALHEKGPYLNPAKQSTATYLSSICQEIVRKYDVDGISLDYIRYPDKASTIRDSRDYKDSRTQKPLADWRRDNITRTMRVIHDDVKAIKPWVRLSTSPIGKYADLSRYRSGGWNARDAVFQDVKLWMREGLVDALFPMMYFRDNHFFPFALDWLEGANGCDVCPGLGVYFLASSQKDWPLSDITRELYFMRQIGVGQCFFRARFLLDNEKGIYDFLLNHNAMLSLPSAMANVTDSPECPTSLRMVCYGMQHGAVEWMGDSLLQYNVYAINKNDTVLLKAMLTEPRFDFNLRQLFHIADTLAIRSLNRYGNESPCVKIALRNRGLTGRYYKN